MKFSVIATLVGSVSFASAYTNLGTPGDKACEGPNGDWEFSYPKHVWPIGNAGNNKYNLIKCPTDGEPYYVLANGVLAELGLPDWLTKSSDNILQGSDTICDAAVADGYEHGKKVCMNMFNRDY